MADLFLPSCRVFGWKGIIEFLRKLRGFVRRFGKRLDLLSLFESQGLRLFVIIS